MENRSIRRGKTSLKHGKMNTEYHGGKMMMIWNNRNNRLGFSPILKRHTKEKKKKKIDNDLIGKERTTTISDLAEEVLTKVLLTLSVKDILACVSVQKSWYSLIKTRMFITLHHNISSSSSSSNPNTNKYLLFWDIFTNSYAIRVDDIQCEEYLTLKFPTHLSRCFAYQLVSNGLICLFNDNIDTKTRDAIYLCNPVIQKYKTLPPSPLPPSSTNLWKAIAFGFVQEINDYLVVHMGRYGLKNKPHTYYNIVTCVYSLSTDSWKKITLDDSSIPIDDISQCDSVFVNGVAIWAGANSRGDHRLLLCFDTKTEMLRQILLPEWLESRSNIWFPFIHAFDQSIAYFVEDNNYLSPRYLSPSKLTVWVLKGDPMNEFVWEKKMMVTLHQGVKARVMGVRNNGEPILCNDYDLISYNLDSRKSYDFVKSWDSWASSYWEDEEEWWNSGPKEPFVITPFAESLALLDVDCTQY